MVTVFTAALLWLTVRRLHYSDWIGILLALLYGLATIAWPYANHFFGEPLSALSLLCCFYGILSYRLTGYFYWILGAGIAAAVAVMTVVAHTLLVAVLGLYLLTFFVYAPAAVNRDDQTSGEADTTSSEPRSRVKRILVASGIYAGPILIAGLLLLWYNTVRFGSPFDNGLSLWQW
ncbi:MAG: hypothetical protein R2867_37950 [Caldilineaceae bacterium]